MARITQRKLLPMLALGFGGAPCRRAGRAAAGSCHRFHFKHLQLLTRLNC